MTKPSNGSRKPVPDRPLGRTIPQDWTTRAASRNNELIAAKWRARETVLSILMPFLLNLRAQISALDDLDPRAPRVGDVSGDIAAGGILVDGRIELDAFRVEFLQEGWVIFHVEADVIENVVAGRVLHFVGFDEAKLHARNAIDHRLPVAHCGFAAEGFRVPGLRLRNVGFRHGEVNVLVTDGDVLRLVLQNFHAHAIGRYDIGLIFAAIVAGKHGDALGFPFGGTFLDVFDNEPDMIHDGALRSPLAF